MKTKRTELAEAVPRRELGLFDEMDRVFDTFMHRGWMNPLRDMWPELTRFEHTLDLNPRIDVVDRETEILVRAELPGVDKNDLTVELLGDLLTIKGERKLEETKEEGAYFRSEIARGAFGRTIRLPAAVAMEETKAEFKDGVLAIHMPKTEKTARHHIEVK